VRVVLINQPFEGEAHRVGDHLLQLLARNNDFNHFRTAVAWARRTGVEQIFQAMQRFRESGGRIEIIVGIDLKGTSVQALRLLQQVTDSVRIFQNANRRYRPTYHPKVYIFSGPAMATAILGSSNLTRGGLYVNYEQNIRLDLDLRNEDDGLMLGGLQAGYQAYANAPNRIVRELTEELLNQLIQRRHLVDEDSVAEQRERSGDQETDETKAGLEPLFGTMDIAPPPEGGRRPHPPGPAGAAAAPAGSAVAASAPVGTPAAVGRRGPILWQKKLAPSDVQSQTGHPTGVVRLTQAKWRVGSSLIDWTTYFRRNLFGGFNWTTARAKPLVEETQIRFDITILGVKLGVQTLKVSDKPSGEAGQRNYTSSLHWGGLGDRIRNANLTGKTLRLYGPAASSSEPFFIEIS
jgi:HKD family nuclease